MYAAETLYFYINLTIYTTQQVQYITREEERCLFYLSLLSTALVPLEPVLESASVERAADVAHVGHPRQYRRIESAICQNAC
jgi:hypothetical protein